MVSTRAQESATPELICKNNSTEAEGKKVGKVEIRKEKERSENSVKRKMTEYKALKTSSALHSKTIDHWNTKKENAVERLRQTEDKLENHKKILQLLPEGEENLEKLYKIVQRTKDKLEVLGVQWQNHKQSLEKEYQDMEENIRIISKKNTNKNKSSPVQKIEEIKAETKEKEIKVKKLLVRVESLNFGEKRESYVARILDIVKQIEKLRDGVDDVISDIKTVQKEINTLNGKLERTFFEVGGVPHIACSKTVQ